jgi:hypothetical protein
MQKKISIQVYKTKGEKGLFDVVMMFEIMILQRYYGLGEKQAEIQ